MVSADRLHDLVRLLAGDRNLTRIISGDLVKRKPSHPV
jgi:hypothetical protein